MPWEGREAFQGNWEPQGTRLLANYRTELDTRALEQFAETENRSKVRRLSFSYSFAR